MVRTPPERWDRQTDVAVVGSGGAGMVAALAAADGGADVAVFEKAPVLGGTTAVSEAGLWLPNSRPVTEAIGETPHEKLVAYVSRIAGDRVPDAKIDRFLRLCPTVLDYLEDRTVLEFHHLPYPDYHTEFEGSHPRGQAVAPDPIDGDALGDLLADVRASHIFKIPVPMREMLERGGLVRFPAELDREEVRRLAASEMVSGGEALIAALYAAALDVGVTATVEAPALDLVVDDGTVVGLVVDDGGDETTIRAGAVVVAAGGMEWDEDLCEQFLRGPMDGPVSPPYNEGDGVEMGMAVGARLENMNEAWWVPTAKIPSEAWEDGSDVYRPIVGERSVPGSLIVNAAGERFCNEAGNYNDLGKTFHEFDPGAYDYRNVPAYLVFDGSYRERYALMNLTPSDPDPDWLTRRETLPELAAALDVDPAGLDETVRAFNEAARAGTDPAFDRGGTAHDRRLGDPDATHPNLGPLDTPPFYGLRLYPGAFGTKGGLVTTVDSEVVAVDGDVIEGLYAASNSAAHVMGIGYAGAGGTLGPNLVFGYVAGERAAAFTTR